MAQTNNGRLLKERRRREIINLIHQQGTVSSKELAEQFDVSLMTIWRDLTVLEEKEMIQRVHGGAASLDNPTIEPVYTHKTSVNSRQKNAIAHYASQHFVGDGQIIILEAGTTAMAMVKYLQQRNLTVITNGLGTLNELATILPKVEVMSCGGVLRDLSNTFVGPQAEHFFESLRAHKLFLGATGIMIDDGISDPNVLEIQVKRAMAACADEVILLLDSSKFGVRSLKTILPMNQITAIITDAKPPDSYVDWLQRENVQLHIVS